MIFHLSKKTLISISERYIESIQQLKTISIAFIEHYEHIRKKEKKLSGGEVAEPSSLYYYFWLFRESCGIKS